MKKAIIFDLDGTIADSFDIFVETLQELLHRPPMAHDEIENLRGLTIPQILTALNIKKWQLPRLVILGRRKVAGKMDQVEIFEGMDDVLKDLSSKGYKLYILSTNSQNAINLLLKKNKINRYIDEIYGDIGLMGKTKFLNKLRRENGHTKADCIYVGDEVRDIHAAQKAGMRCLSVTWGYSSPRLLKQHNAGNIVSSPQGLLERF